MASVDAKRLAPTGTLLSEVFPGSDVARPDYLKWLYQDSPFGPIVEANFDDDIGRAGHYALTPITMARDDLDYAAALSLNTAVHQRARGGGLFVRLASEVIAEARRRGISAVVGVANANSTPGFLRHLEFELVGPLPATLLIPTPGSTTGIHSTWAKPAAFAPDGLLATSEPMLDAPAAGEARRWTPATLSWRLARPRARYALHAGPDVLAVSCRDRRHGVAVAILLKVFAPHHLSGRRLRALVRAVCRFHRAPFGLHVGINNSAAFSGPALPRRFRESPLNLIYRSLEEERRPPSIVRFEFLDFDAY